MSLKQDDYKHWFGELKQKFQQTQLKAATQVNSTLLEFYWDLGSDIVEKQKNSVWGDGFLPQLSQDLMTAFPEIKGFSQRNMAFIRQWYLFWNQQSAIVKQPVSQLSQQLIDRLMQIPWGHNLKIIAKCKHKEEAL
ncbi:MAG: DUF1016 N-terminal domain-containing protein, partial [Ghiorsea sp.]